MAESLDDTIEPIKIYYDEDFHLVEKLEDAVWEEKFVEDDDGELVKETLRIKPFINE